MAASPKAPPPTSYEGLPTTERELKSYFRQHGLDLNRPCTSAAENAASTTAVQRCWVLESRVVWNRVLHAFSLELLEDSPGRLTVQTSILCPPDSYKYKFVGAFLLATLLKDHPCVHHVEMKHVSRMMSDVGFLLNAVVPNDGIKQISLTDQRQLHPRYRHKAMKLINAALRGNPCVLRFYAVYFSCSLRKALCEDVASAPRLSELTLYDNGLVVREVVRVVEAVKASTSITSLNLDKNSVFLRGARCIADLLRSSTSLTEVSLCDTGIDDEGATIIAGALKTNSTLQNLNLGNNDIFNFGARELSRALSNNISLRTLNLERNEFEDSGTICLAEMLRANTTLQELNLSHLKMTLNGLSKIVDSLKANRTLLVLTIRGIKFEERCMTELTSLLRVNNTLTRLNFWTTWLLMTEAQFGDFVECIMRNRSMDGLEIEIHCSADTQMLSRTVQLHKTLRYLSIIRSGHYDISPLLSALKKNKCVEVLEIDYLLGSEIWALGSLVTETTTIRSLTLSYSVNSTGFICLMYGLSRNKSLWKFSLECTTLKAWHCTEISRVLDNNETLNHLLLHNAPTNEAGLATLANAMSTNETLQQLTITFPTSSLAGLRVRECLQRNCSRMARAMEFALTKTLDKRSADAFEAFRDSELFVQKLADATGGRREAETLLLEANMRKLRYYFVITKVVKNMLVCLKSPDNERSTKIDRLNEYCLLEIVSHLKISDVK